MKLVARALLAVGLSGVIAAAVLHPTQMVAPGTLIPGHAALEDDCFACHRPFFGATKDRCRSCHDLAQIGILTTAGLPIEKPLTSVPFHQELVDDDCLACHSDHSGVMRLEVRDEFDHTMLRQASLERCSTCHAPPGDDLHRKLSGNCNACHSVTAWTPARFDHDRYFLLDGNHDARCMTCHVQNDYSRYTCYGCHEHTPAGIRREHVEEGIRDFDDCVECHRSPDEKAARERGRKRHRHGRDHESEDG